MIADASAILAILLDEPEKDSFMGVILRAGRCSISAPNFLEASIVYDSRSRAKSDDLAALVEALDIDVVTFTVDHAMIARDAYRRYGRGTHKAKLNFGDCFAYALAVDTGRPLLFKGDDFAQTDVLSAL